jgi:hypothetical protein
MSIEDVFIAIGFIVFCLAIIYYFGQCMSFNTSIIEGLENKPDESAAKPAGGVGANAAAYADSIKALTVKIQDELLIDKYKGDYEKVIIATDDLIDMLMVKTALSVKYDPTDPNKSTMSLYALNYLKTSKDALNDVMKTIDKGGSTTTTTTTSSSSSFGF